MKVKNTKHGYMTSNPSIYKKIKELQFNQKKYPTKAERIMWEYLRNKKTGYKIRRQHIIDRYIADFVCLSKKLVIEIDGNIHCKKRDYDEYRTSRLRELGYEVIRFTNNSVYLNPEAVVKEIMQKIEKMSLSSRERT